MSEVGVICEQCRLEGKKSKVYEGYGLSTCLGWTPYYDENGKRHSHDPNSTVSTYSCSNGHKWSEVIKRSCPTCGKDWK